MSIPWPESIIDQLKALAEQGMSASMAAGHIDGMTRNAAVGIAFRRKFQFHSMPGHNRTPSRRAARVSPPTATAIEPEPERVGMLTLPELKPDDCRWPMGDPRSPDFRYCGQRVSRQSYCANHHRLAFETQEQRRARLRWIRSGGLTRHQ